ncbi:NAD(P)/FAD-dependent oxidoreductase [Cohnella fermenti]|uniref:Ferredoxin--NADP reductase n=1 Tax=Cohnella fermenti TaxID=2565925 RepID=A0A4S4BEQ0_9BACL|nr:NAD(P)/FAD-dependent oxidoreductase [Cohnella fermenti]THF72704.1 NAD(P)/FAD-dependent oxidoreductase [Cohnella fermenti]
MQRDEAVDVTIVGGGPAGLFAAFYSGLRQMTTKLIEYQPVLGGKVHVYAEKMIWDIGGLTPVSGERLIEQLVAQGLTFEPEVVLGQKVVGLSKDEEGLFLLRTSSGETHRSRTVILAVGYGILKPTKLDIEGAERFELTNLSYTVKSLHRFAGKTVLISGGGNSALEWALELEPIAERVVLTHRKDTFSGHEATIHRLLHSSVECLFHTTIGKLIASPERDRIAQVVLNRQGEEASLELSVDEVIVSHGFDRDKDLLENSGLDIAMQDEYGIAGTPMSETSVPGLYAAGDILHHPGKLHLIAGAFQDAANAVNRAKQFIEPDARAWGTVSSHNDLFSRKNRELQKHLYKQ